MTRRSPIVRSRSGFFSSVSLTYHINLPHVLQEKSKVLKMYVNSDVESVVCVNSSLIKCVVYLSHQSFTSTARDLKFSRCTSSVTLRALFASF
jgi:hypothetical protein